MSPGKLNMTNGGDGLACPTLRQWRAGSVVSSLAGDEIVVWLIELDAGLESQTEIDDTEPGPELELLDSDERVRAGRFIRARDRRRFARCRSALREILGGLLCEQPRLLRFRAVARGKPELDFPSIDGGEPPVRFNVSHSSELAVIAVCRSRELGIDLEQVRAIGEAERIVESFFSADELAEFGQIGSEQKAMAFLRGWTRKEAILKGLGVGIAGLADRYETGFGTGELGAGFSPARPLSRVGQWQLWEASPRTGFVATVACRVDAANGCASAIGGALTWRS